MGDLAVQFVRGRNRCQLILDVAIARRRRVERPCKKAAKGEAPDPVGGTGTRGRWGVCWAGGKSPEIFQTTIVPK